MTCFFCERSLPKLLNVQEKKEIIPEKERGRQRERKRVIERKRERERENV